MSRCSSLRTGLRLTATVAEESLGAVAGVLGGSPSSGLGIRFATRGYTFFTNPSASSLLRILGSDEEEQVETLSDLLRNSSEDEINDLMGRLTQAVTRLAEERAEGGDGRQRRRTRSGSSRSGRRRGRRRSGLRPPVPSPAD